MPRRRILVFAIAALLGVVVLNAMAPTERPFDGDAPSGASAAPAPADSAAVEGSLPEDRRVRATVGDVVRLEVVAGASDTVEIVGLELQAPVDPGVPSEFVFVADQPGQFPVRLREANEEVGTLQIAG